MIIRNALAALPGEKEFKKVDISVHSGKIKEILISSSAPAEEGTEGSSIDAAGLMLFPGAIDPHVHFDEPGFTHREDFLHGSAEAARGGVTTVVDMPCTSLPPVTSLGALASKLKAVESKALVDFAFFGGINGLFSLSEIEEAVKSLSPYVVGFKAYTISGMDSFAAVSDAQFAWAASQCALQGRPILLHAEDPQIIAEAQAALSGTRAAKAHGWRDYYAGRPMEAELAACAAAVALAGQAAPYLHVVHVGTAEAAQIVFDAGATCETCAHYLAFDEEDFESKGASLKTAPPVKEVSQKARLWKLLSQGRISFLASDHAGAPDYEKFTGDPLTAYGGIPGTGTLFPYLLSEGLFARRLDLPSFVAATAGNAARRYGLLGGKGSISPGKDADFVLVDPESTSLVDPASMFSKSKITPFAGMRLAGRIAATFVRGQRIFDSGRIPPETGSAQGPGIPGLSSQKGGRITGKPGSGKFIQWGYR
ncbi:MAG: amidohydrolase family protein [Spirochaetota bacterium]